MEEFQCFPRCPRKMVLYSSTKFGIFKFFTIISNHIRFDWGFWQASKQIYRKLEYRKKVLEEFQRLPRFARKMVLYSSTKFGIFKPLTIISNHIRIDIGFFQASKQTYRKLKYRENNLEKFQCFPRCPRKMVLYSSTKFGILKPLTIISNLIRFDLGFWQASKPFYRKLNYRENDLEEFQRLPRFSRKMVLYSSTKFGILKPLTSISNYIRCNLGSCQASKEIYRKLEYNKKVLEEFLRLPLFPRKMVLYSSTKFGILKPWSIISNLIRFDLGFWQASKSIHRKLKYKENNLEEFQCLLRFTRKMVL